MGALQHPVRVSSGRLPDGPTRSRGHPPWHVPTRLVGETGLEAVKMVIDKQHARFGMEIH